MSNKVEWNTGFLFSVVTDKDICKQIRNMSSKLDRQSFITNYQLLELYMELIESPDASMHYELLCEIYNYLIIKNSEYSRNTIHYY